MVRQNPHQIAHGGASVGMGKVKMTVLLVHPATSAPG
jgi:hypothetical protein